MTSTTERSHWRTDVSLRDLNTLALPAVAAHYYPVTSTSELLAALEYFNQHTIQPLILGAGSNVVLVKKEYAHCLHLAMRGVQLVQRDNDSVLLDVAAGENWNKLVNYCLKQGYFGLENLALIPGTVGAAPIQNIGAYGVELEQFVEEVRFVDLESGVEQTFDRQQCEFSYRDSTFKRAWQDRCVITRLRLKLSTVALVNTRYQSLADELNGLSEPSPEDVRDAVVAIRQRKLPDPEQIPNVGSFFKNPVVEKAHLRDLQARYSGVVSYPTADPSVFKLAAGWLLEAAGWKGYRANGAGVHDEQALVLINSGAEDGRSIMDLAAKIRADIEQKFAVVLEVEPRVYD